MTWSRQQDAALRTVSKWLADDSAPQVFRLFGYAGTGKSTLAQEIAQSAGGCVLFAAFTGKAALVMRSKGCWGARTIHSMIYRAEELENGEVIFVLNNDSDMRHAGLCIIDECSMVGRELALDLLSFNVKVLVLGDPAQLPPVGDAGFFTTEPDPDVMLTEVHRQARDNPIIRISMDVRAGNNLQVADNGACRVIARASLCSDDVMHSDQVLVGRNRTRMAFNSRMRQLLNRPETHPVVGDKLVCLRNNRNKALLNGGLWVVESLRESKSHYFKMTIAAEDADTPRAHVDVHPYFFLGREAELSQTQRKMGDAFTYGYALTVHKSQGSQWNNVLLFDESAAFRDDSRRWLYTGITRAAKALTVVIGTQP
jgi:exodeoxyribonuclease V